METYSQDLRDRVLRALERGDRPTAIANRFEVSRVDISGAEPTHADGTAEESTLWVWLQETGHLTLAEMCARLAARGIASKVPALWHQLDKWKMTLKKTLHASEQDHADVQAAQPALDITKLVFLDETGASTNMARRYGRAPRGERCVGSIPHGHWHTTTFIAGLRHDDITAPMVADGAMTGALFLKYVQEFLCPTLHPGDIVIADNLRSHTVAGVKAAVESESHRKTVCHTQSAAPQSRHAHCGRTLE